MLPFHTLSLALWPSSAVSEYASMCLVVLDSPVLPSNAESGCMNATSILNVPVAAIHACV